MDYPPRQTSLLEIELIYKALEVGRGPSFSRAGLCPLRPYWGLPPLDPRRGRRCQRLQHRFSRGFSPLRPLGLAEAAINRVLIVRRTKVRCHSCAAISHCLDQPRSHRRIPQLRLGAPPGAVAIDPSALTIF